MSVETSTIEDLKASDALAMSRGHEMLSMDRLVLLVRDYLKIINVVIGDSSVPVMDLLPLSERSAYVSLDDVAMLENPSFVDVDDPVTLGVEASFPVRSASALQRIARSPESKIMFLAKALAEMFVGAALDITRPVGRLFRRIHTQTIGRHGAIRNGLLSYAFSFQSQP